MKRRGEDAVLEISRYSMMTDVKLQSANALHLHTGVPLSITADQKLLDAMFGFRILGSSAIHTCQSSPTAPNIVHDPLVD